jgi:hypothetical protein
MISTSSPSTDPLSNIMALDGHHKISIYKKSMQSPSEFWKVSMRNWAALLSKAELLNLPATFSQHRGRELKFAKKAHPV